MDDSENEMALSDEDDEQPYMEKVRMRIMMRVKIVIH